MADRIALSKFVETVADEWLVAVAAVETKHPDWQVGASEIVARVAFVLEKGKVLIDLDEPERLLTEVRIPLRRKDWLG